MFWNRNKINKKMIPNLTPTSKASLKMMCLMSSNGDIEKASKLYEYMIKDMEDLPMFDVRPPSTMDQIKTGLNDAVHWLGENQDQILTWVDVIGGMFRKSRAGVGAATGAVNPSGNPLPNINK